MAVDFTYRAVALADEIEELINRHKIDGATATSAIAIILAKYGKAAADSGLMSKESLIDQVASVAKNVGIGVSKL